MRIGQTNEVRGPREEIRTYIVEEAKSCGEPRQPLLDEALGNLASVVSEYENTIDRINAIVFGKERCDEPAASVEPKLISVIKRLTTDLESSNKQLYMIKENLAEHFGELKL